jgi:uncharacterized surface protein with fasciclin (FAS1) repeats
MQTHKNTKTPQAGLADSLTKQSFKETIFVPTNAAFAASGINLDKVDKVRH